MARAGTVATLLPGAFYFMRETRLPPIDALRAAGVPIALATDCNPGTSPLTSPLLVMNMGATLFRSEEHTSELQSLMRISYAVFCLKTTKHRDTTYAHSHKQK